MALTLIVTPWLDQIGIMCSRPPQSESGLAIIGQQEPIRTRDSRRGSSKVRGGVIGGPRRHPRIHEFSGDRRLPGLVVLDR